MTEFFNLSFLLLFAIPQNSKCVVLDDVNHAVGKHPS